MMQISDLTVWPVRLRMAAKADGDFLDLHRLGGLDMEMASENGGFLCARVTVIIPREKEHWLGQRDTDGDPIARGHDLFVAQDGQAGRHVGIITVGSCPGCGSSRCAARQRGCGRGIERPTGHLWRHHLDWLTIP